MPAVRRWTSVANKGGAPCLLHELSSTAVSLRPGPGEVVLRVRAAGVNFPDALIVQNLYQFKPTPPFSPGGETAGEEART